MPSTSLYDCVYAIRSTDQVLHYRGMVSQTDETLVGLLSKLKHRAGITATSLYRVGVAYQEVWHYREVAWRHRQICDFSSVRNRALTHRRTYRPDDRHFSAQSGQRWRGLPGGLIYQSSLGSEASLMVRCLFQPVYGKNTVLRSAYTTQDREWAKPAYQGNSKHCSERGHPEDKKKTLLTIHGYSHSRGY